jgi:anti-sigma factor RsiW
MDCRNFKELLDSYLSGELAVETNHDVQRHAELCAPCRQEMGARRQLRGVLREAATKITLSVEGSARLHARLRADGVPHLPFMARFLPRRASLATAAAIVFALLLGGAYGFFLLRQQSVSAAELSPALMNQAAGDHNICAPAYLNREGRTKMSAENIRYDPTYADLDQAAEVGAQGLRLRSAHVCSFGERRFAHLVYLRDTQLISLLVTERNERAMKRGVVPGDDGLPAGWQGALSDHCAVNAYQTAKHVVLIVSQLPEKENQELAARIARPVCEHLRRLEKSSAALEPHQLDWPELASELRRGPTERPHLKRE